MERDRTPKGAVGSDVKFVTDPDAAKETGLRTTGWSSHTTYTSADGNIRHRVETLVAMSPDSAPAVEEEEVKEEVVSEPQLLTEVPVEDEEKAKGWFGR